MFHVDSPKKHPFLPLIRVEAGTLIKKLVGEHWLEKARGVLLVFLSAGNTLQNGAGDVSRMCPKLK